METKEQISEKLTVEQFQVVMDALPELIASVNGDQFFTAEYGFGCKLHNDLLYIPMTLLPNHLASFFRDSIAQQIFSPGDDDLHIRLSDGRLKITLCHEGDVHVGGIDPHLVARFLSTLPFSEFRFYQSRA